VQRKVSSAVVRQVRRTIKAYEMIGRDDRVLVAVSGGPDSITLLAVLAALLAERRGVYAAHFNHHLRGDEAIRDQRCAEAVAQHFGVPCVVGHSATLGVGPNLEARARAARYEFLERVAMEQGCAKIATGHTLDDQAETIVMRLVRGTGWDGLRGIRPVRDGRIIRPLIECSRAEVMAYLAERRLPYCEDSTNRDRRFLRNRVRHEVLPLLEAMNPNVKRTLASSAGIVEAEAHLLDVQVASILHAVAPENGLPVAVLRDAPPGLRGRLLRSWLRSENADVRRLTAQHVRGAITLALGARPNGRLHLPSGQWLIREYHALHLGARQAGSAVPEGHLLAPGGAVQLRSGWRISAELVSCPRLGDPLWPADLWTVVADAETVRAPLVVRTLRPGDRIAPLGMQGHRKLQDVLVDRKLPTRMRRACAVIECAGEILWVPGVVRSNFALITPATRSALLLRAAHSAIAGE